MNARTALAGVSMDGAEVAGSGNAAVSAAGVAVLHRIEPESAAVVSAGTIGAVSTSFEGLRVSKNLHDALFRDGFE